MHGTTVRVMLLAGGLALVSACAPSSAPEPASAPATSEPAPASESAVPVALFDGSSLDGWEGDDRYWSVEDGAIVGRSTATPLERNTFLVWMGEVPGDFDLRAEVMVLGNNNSGIQYRSTRGDGFAVTGYQCDIHPRAEYNGMLYEEGGRGIVATAGSRIAIGADGTKTEMGEPGEAVEVALDEWHEFRVVVEGNRLAHFIDDREIVVVEDDDATHAVRQGVIALQLHAGGAYEVRFRRVRLRGIE